MKVKDQVTPQIQKPLLNNQLCPRFSRNLSPESGQSHPVIFPVKTQIFPALSTLMDSKLYKDNNVRKLKESNLFGFSQRYCLVFSWGYPVSTVENISLLSSLWLLSHASCQSVFCSHEVSNIYLERTLLTRSSLFLLQNLL